jgi:hypothetical protein
VELKADWLKGVRIQGHFHIDRFPIFKPTVNIESDLPIPNIVNGRLIGNDPPHRQSPSDKGGKEPGERPLRFRGVPSEHRLENIIQTDVYEVIGILESDFRQSRPPGNLFPLQIYHVPPFPAKVHKFSIKAKN